MIILQIGKGVQCYNLPKDITNKVIADLTFINPKYINAQRHGAYISFNTPKYLRFFETSKDQKIIWIPRGYLWYLQQALKSKGLESKIEDNTLTFEPLNLKFQGVLRPYQRKAVHQMVSRYPQGVLEAATGAGKTVMGCGIIVKRKQPTLIIVHNKELLCQWQRAIQKFLHYDCGLVGDGKFVIKNITVGIINTVRNKINNLMYEFGHIIIDECFPAGTIIDGKPIEQYKVSNYVNSFNHKTRRIEKKRVTHLFKKKPETLCTVKLVSGKEITCTENHPFYTNKGYLPASQLNSEFVYINTQSEVGKFEKVESVTIHKQTSGSGFGSLCKDGYVYNIEVEDNHNYFVDGVLVHNCHRTPSTTFTETLKMFPARYYLGLSATPFRRDGLGKAIYCHIGAKLHEVNKKELQNTGAVLKPLIIKVRTQFRIINSFTEDIKYSQIIKQLVTDDTRNNIIIDTVCKDIKRYKENTLIVSDRVSHCKELADKLKDKEISCHVLSSKVNKSKRADIVADVKAGKCKVLIATLSLIGEGFDAHNLTALHLTTPIAFSGRLLQTIGRVLRPGKGKVPRVFDYRDDNIGILRNSGIKRNAVYEKEWGV